MLLFFSGLIFFSCDPVEVSPIEDIKLQATLKSYKIEGSFIVIDYRVRNLSKIPVPEYFIWFEARSGNSKVFQERFQGESIKPLNHVDPTIKMSSLGLEITELHVLRVSVAK
jgi:hypothetical protein